MEKKKVEVDQIKDLKTTMSSVGEVDSLTEFGSRELFRLTDSIIIDKGKGSREKKWEGRGAEEVGVGAGVGDSWLSGSRYYLLYVRGFVR